MTSDSAFYHKKSLGQHFLRDQTILQRIVNAAGNLSESFVLEVGPGLGSLTKHIIDAHPQHLWVIEKDERLRENLGKLAIDRLVFADALKHDIFKDINNKITLIANLPYNIASPLLHNYLMNINHFDQMVVMIQKEVAQRITAIPGICRTAAHLGKFSFIFNYLCHTHKVMDVHPGSFFPPPKVMSTVIRIVPRPDRLFKPSFISYVARILFGAKRKMLLPMLRTLGCTPSILDTFGKLRAQELTLDQFELIMKDSNQELMQPNKLP